MAEQPPTVAPPVFRKLRVFAFDPSLSTQLATAGINEVTLRVPWEVDQSGNEVLQPGPVGEYLEVIDVDPPSECQYWPVNLNDLAIVAEDGLMPSETNPQFHQQMVYAVAMRIIRDFERILGRVVLWAPRHHRPSPRGRWRDDFVRRLRVYPHALREANAYYSPEKKALLFGYFPAPSGGGSQLTVFTCLSHDIIAHEVTHALLDGIHRRFSEPSNRDVLAFHEAFADAVALFEHFSLPTVLRHHIAETRGDLESQNRLGELAQQFGEATGRRGALRSAIGEIDPETGKWKPKVPDPKAYETTTEPHARGAILVAAVFDAFLTIYKSRVADLLRIATGGTGVLPAGQIHPDLVDRLADEAARAARRVLEMCVRALDYCPPVDITFGDYLRALVTADFESDPVDESNRRVAFVEAFRSHGIVPEGIRALSVDGLRWQPASDAPDVDEDFVVEDVVKWRGYTGAWSLSFDRAELFRLTEQLRARLHRAVVPRLRRGEVELRGIDPKLPVEIHSFRPATVTDVTGELRFLWVVELTQLLVEGEQRFRGGCTLLLDGQTGKLRYSIRKPLSATRKERQQAFLMHGGDESLAGTYFAGGVTTEAREPFALLHRI